MIDWSRLGPGGTVMSRGFVGTITPRPAYSSWTAFRTRAYGATRRRITHGRTHWSGGSNHDFRDAHGSVGNVQFLPRAQAAHRGKAGRDQPGSERSDGAGTCRGCAVAAVGHFADRSGGGIYDYIFVDRAGRAGCVGRGRVRGYPVYAGAGILFGLGADSAGCASFVGEITDDGWGVTRLWGPRRLDDRLKHLERARVRLATRSFDCASAFGSLRSGSQQKQSG